MKNKMLFLGFLSLLFVLKSNAQYWDFGGVTPTGGNGYLQTNGAGYNIYFGNNTTQMTLTTAGDLNILGAARGYQINSSYVIWNNNIPSNIYVGFNAGNVSSSATGNTLVGYEAGNLINSGTGNTALGYYAFYSATIGSSGSNNAALGSHALYSNSSGNYNSATGEACMQSNTTGSQNTANGVNALITNTAGHDNVAMGYQALYYNSTNNFNTAIGENSLYYNTQDYNTALGYYSLYNNTTGQYNTATGTWALDDNQTGNNNTAVGYEALLNNTTDDNIAMGLAALLKNTSGTLNTAIGVDAIYANTILSGNVAVGDSALYGLSYNQAALNMGNVAIGNSALYNNQGVAPGGTPAFNTALGQWSLRDNVAGYYNTATGGASLYTNGSGGMNTADGVQALYSNTTAYDNTATGYEALFSNTTGGANTADGYEALFSNVNGSSNTATGNIAGYNSTGSFNTFSGSSAGYYNGSGSNNTYIGFSAGDATGFSTVSNTTCLGNTSGFFASSITSNSVYLGNNAIQYVYAVPLGFSAYSDRRIKDSIKNNVPGLAFINKLQPVTYNLDIHKEASLMNVQDTINWPGKYDVEKIKQSGFIAQAVDSAAQACGYNFSGLGKPQSPNGLYTLGYTTFVVPLVKAVQELSAKNDTLHDSLRSMRSTLDSLRNTLQSIQTCLSQLCNNTGGQGVTSPQNGGNSNNNTNSTLNTQDITLSGSTGMPLLYQNMPNPFGTGGTKINYYLPDGTMGASIIFYDTYGNMLKTVQLGQTGNGTLNITPDNLSNGIYSYSLIVNGAVIDTKKMLLQK